MRTKRARLGPMVTVLPWWEPIRVAESFTPLDQPSAGRAILGLDRRPSSVEFAASRLNMDESRRLFAEHADAVVQGLETGYMEYDGELYHRPRVKIRPQPYVSFKNRAFASAISSPYSIDLMVRIGCGLADHRAEAVRDGEEELDGYRDHFRRLNGIEAPKPVMNVFVAVSENPGEAQRMREVFMQRYARSTVEHCELAKNFAQHGLDKFNSFVADLQMWGTPEQVIAKLSGYVNDLDLGALRVTLSYGGGMPPEVARANYDLFVRKAMPALKAYDVGGDMGVRCSPPSEFADRQIGDAASI